MEIPHEIKVTDGKGIIRIKSAEIGSYFFVKTPLSVVWGDFRGSVGQYFCLLPFSEQYRKFVQDKVNENLWKDYSDDNSILTDFDEFFQLFENGSYFVNYYKEYGWNEEWDLAFNSDTSTTDAFSRKREAKTVRLANGEMLELIADGFYDGNSDYFVFTRPIESIDEQRVNFFETEIRNGKRPFAIVFQQAFREEGKYPDGSVYIKNIDSADFVVDGHHKLLAYRRLHLRPPVLKIERRLFNHDDLNFNVNELEGLLLINQLKHIKDNLSGVDEGNV